LFVYLKLSVKALEILNGLFKTFVHWILRLPAQELLGLGDVWLA